MFRVTLDVDENVYYARPLSPMQVFFFNYLIALKLKTYKLSPAVSVFFCSLVYFLVKCLRLTSRNVLSNSTLEESVEAYERLLQLRQLLTHNLHLQKQNRNGNGNDQSTHTQERTRGHHDMDRHRFPAVVASNY